MIIATEAQTIVKQVLLDRSSAEIAKSLGYLDKSIKSAAASGEAVFVWNHGNILRVSVCEIEKILKDNGFTIKSGVDGDGEFTFISWILED